MRVCWYMRGSISISEAYYLDNTDRAVINDLIKENMETTKKTSLPFI